MKVEDRHIEAALRLGSHQTPLKMEGVITKIKQDPDYFPHRYILSHAQTLAKLECAVEALERAERDMPICVALVDVEQALIQIRSESHE